MQPTLALHPDMGAVVAKHLRQFGPLPSSGILAGQAVDSALTDLYGAGSGVYNDVDVFRNVPGTSARRVSAVATAHRSKVLVQSHAGYDGMSLAMTLVQSYAIKSVSRQGMLNFVNCTMASGQMTQRLTAEQVITSFDLNCTRVAVDLSTGRLVWDAAYEEFLRSRQLRITMMHTPWHTFLRLVKKARELPGVYVDLEAAAQACVGVAQSKCLKELATSRDVSMLFGSKHHQLALSLQDAWAPYFRLEPKTFHSGPSPQAGWREAGDDVVTPDGHRACVLWRLAPRAQLETGLQQRLDQLQRAVVFFAPKVVAEARRVRAVSSRQKLERLIVSREAEPAQEHRPDFVLACAKVFETDYVAGQSLPTVASKLSSWLRKHPAFTSSLLGLSLAEQWAAVARIQRTCREFADRRPEVRPVDALGVLETQAGAEDVSSGERLLALLERDYRSSRVPFDVQPLPLPARIPAAFEGFSVTELLTPLALKQEGATMQHCVGGYAHAVRSGRSRILSVRHTHGGITWRSTVELQGRFTARTSAGRRLRVSQNHTRQNQKPSAQNREFVAFLLEYLSLEDQLDQSDVCGQVAAAVSALERLETQRAALRAQGDETDPRALDAEIAAKTKLIRLLETLCGPRLSPVAASQGPAHLKAFFGRVLATPS